MKSSVSTSTIDERMIRKYCPRSISVIAVTGRTMCSAMSSACANQLENSSPGVIWSPAGKIGIATAKTKIRMIPIQYSGAA
jgi:hypothetical protein